MLEIKYIYPLRFPLPTHVANGPGETARQHLSVISLSLALSSHHRLQHSARLPGSYLPLLHCIGLEKIAHGQHICMHVCSSMQQATLGSSAEPRDENGTDISRPYSNLIQSGSVFYPSVFDPEYTISVTDPYPNAQKLHFYDVDIHYNLIRIRLRIQIQIGYRYWILGYGYGQIIILSDWIEFEYGRKIIVPFTSLFMVNKVSPFSILIPELADLLCHCHFVMSLCEPPETR